MEINPLLTAMVILIPVVFFVLLLSPLGERIIVWKILALLLAAGSIWCLYAREFPVFVLLFISMIVNGLIIAYQRMR